jgi:hypothetical protein
VFSINQVTAAARRRAAVLSLVGAHLGLVLIGLFDRLEFTRRPQFEFLELVASSELWLPIHFGVAMALLVTSMRHPLALSRALSASAASMGTWSFFTLLWGLWPVGPVALGAPVLGASVAVGAHLLSRSYAEAAMMHGEG